MGISPDDHWLVVGSFDGAARLWDLAAEDPLANPLVLRGHDSRINAVAISCDNHWAVTGSSDGTARLWDLTAKDPSTKQLVFRLGEGCSVHAVAISSDNHWLVTDSGQWPALLWDLTAENPSAKSIALGASAGGVPYSALGLTRPRKALSTRWRSATIATGL